MIVALWLVPLLLAAAAFPRWPYSRQVGLCALGRAPAGGIAGAGYAPQLHDLKPRSGMRRNHRLPVHAAAEEQPRRLAGGS